MNEEEDCDDLPSITVNTSENNSSTFAMPSAEELAEQRARELECEQQLEQLRQRARTDELAALRHSDSSGSEGELALAAAVTALSVRAPPPRGARCGSPRAAALWAAMLPHLPPPAAALQAELSAARAGAVLARAVAALAGALAAEAGPWAAADLQCAAALLSVALLAHESRCRRAAARALHELLDDHATTDQVSALGGALLAALPAARARLRLSDGLRSGAGAGADAAAAALAGAALLQLLPELGAAAWRECPAAARSACVQLAGRLLAAAPAHPAAPRLLALLSEAPATPGDALDKLKVSVGVSKLKLLFCTKNGVSGRARPQRDAST